MATEKPLELPLHQFPLQNKELEETELFSIVGPGTFRVLTGFRDPGEAVALLPVIERLIEKSSEISILADSRAKQGLETSGLNFSRFESDDPLLRIAAAEADVIFTGFSNHPGTEMALTAKGILNDTPVVWIEDYPGGIFDHYRNRRPTVGWVIPDYICAISDYGKQQELKYEPLFDPDKIIITGQPAHDRFAEEDRDTIKAKVRQVLGITKDVQLITYMGIPQLASAEALKLLLFGLSKSDLTDYKFVLRRHPRDTTQPVEYQQIMSSISDKIIDTSQFRTDEVGIASDLVITTMSSTGTDAVYRGIPSIHILEKGILSNSEVGADFATPDMVSDGASIGIFEEDEMLPALQNIFFNPAFLTDLKVKMNRFKPEVGATDRVAQLIISLAEKSRYFKR